MKSKFLCIGLSLLLGVTLLSACSNNSKNVVDNKENKDTIEFDADVWKSKDYVARYNMIDSLFEKEDFNDFRYTLQDLTNLLGEPDKTDTLVLETYPTQFGGYQYYYWVDSQKYSGRREWILFSITPQEKVGGYSINAYGYNDNFNDDVSIELSDGVGEQIPPTGQFKLTIIDEHGYIYDKPEQQYFTPFTEIKLHSYPIMDADLYMYVDGEFYSKQTSIETDEGYIWEYTFTMPIGEAILEFSTDPFSPHTYYSFADIFNWVSLLNESTLKAVEIEDGYIGVDPNNPNNAPIIRYSEKIEDINYNLLVLEIELLVKVHDYEPVDGGWYRKVKYITFEGQEYILKISNGLVFWNDFSSYEYFRFDRTPTNYPDIITENK